MAALPEADGSIRIAARAGYMGDAVICELGDDGPGMPAGIPRTDLRAVLHHTSGGTGLGLYIARELADANGCALELLPKVTGRHVPHDVQARADAGRDRLESV